MKVLFVQRELPTPSAALLGTYSGVPNGKATHATSHKVARWSPSVFRRARWAPRTRCRRSRTAHAACPTTLGTAIPCDVVDAHSEIALARRTAEGYRAFSTGVAFQAGHRLAVHRCARALSARLKRDAGGVNRTRHGLRFRGRSLADDQR